MKKASLFRYKIAELVGKFQLPGAQRLNDVEDGCEVEVLNLPEQEFYLFENDVSISISLT